jgi:hypothetical protein
LGDMTEGRSEAEGHRRLHTRTHRRDSLSERDQVHGLARTMFVCDAPPLGRRPEHRIDRLTPIRPQMGRLLETWCVCQWPNEVHASALRPGQGGVCPPPSLQGASTLQQQGSDASTHTDNGDDDDTDIGQDDGGRARELHRDSNAVPAGSSERTGCERARPSAVPVCLRPCRDHALSDAVQAVAGWATATKAAAVAVPAMWPGDAMSRGLGVWQRRLLAALEERPTVSLVDVLPRPYARSQYVALRT